MSQWYCDLFLLVPLVYERDQQTSFEYQKKVEKRLKDMKGESLIKNLCDFSVRVEFHSLLRYCECVSYNKGCCTLCICQVWPSIKCIVDTEQLFQLKLTLALSFITTNSNSVQMLEAATFKS